MARARGVKKIDNVRWQTGTFAATGLSAGNLGQVFLAADTNPVTLLRMRGTIACYMDGFQGPAPLVQVTTGVILVPEGSGTTVQYDPLADSNAPWIFYSTFFVGYEEMVADVIDVPVISGYREIIDNKAMRKIRPDVELQQVVTNTTILAAGTINFVMACRLLVGF